MKVGIWIQTTLVGGLYSHPCTTTFTPTPQINKKAISTSTTVAEKLKVLLSSINDKQTETYKIDGILWKNNKIVLLKESNHITFYINFQSPRRFNEGNRGDDRILQLTEIHRQQLAELKQRNEKLQEEKASMEMYNYSKY